MVYWCLNTLYTPTANRKNSSTDQQTSSLLVTGAIAISHQLHQLKNFSLKAETFTMLLALQTLACTTQLSQYDTSQMQQQRTNHKPSL